jgi:hypothetical protein
MMICGGANMTKRTIRIALPSLTALLLLTGTSLLAQVYLSGSWAARNYGDALGVNPGPGPLPVEYFGLPLNEAAARCCSSMLRKCQARIASPPLPPHIF